MTDRFPRALSLRFALAFVLAVAAATPAAALMWIPQSAIDDLPMSGVAWDALLEEANEPTGVPDVSNGSAEVNVRVLAKALVYARTGIESYRTEVRQACSDVIGTEGDSTLDLGRELMAFVVSAELVGLPPAEDAAFRAWIDAVRTTVIDGRTLINTHEERPNNWGTHAGASRIAVAIYLGDTTDLQAAADVFKGWLGDRATYAGFLYGELSWQADAANPVGVNPLGSTIGGNSVDGVLPDDQRRGGPFQWPPPKVNYVYEAMQGALAQAVLLHQAGYTDVWDWEDQALLRAFEWLQTVADFPATGDDDWQPYLINRFYGTDYETTTPTQPGKNVGWTDWTHAGPFCGDGLEDPGEDCDDGNSVEGDGCDSNCTLSACANGIVSPSTGEQCDDGNLIAGDCCDPSCLFEPAASLCDDGEVCTSIDGCDGAGSCVGVIEPADLCAAPTGLRASAVSMKRRGTKRSLTWKWTKGPAIDPLDLGDPITSHDYSVCIYEYDGDVTSLLLSAMAPSGPAWKPMSGQGFKYKVGKESPEGLRLVLVKPGAEGKAKQKVKGKGAALAYAPLGVDAGSVITVQLRGGASACFETAYTPPFLKNTPELFKDRTD